MSWSLEITKRAHKDLKRLGIPARRRILEYFEHRILTSENPKSRAKRIVGISEEVWRYRVGTYRVLVKFEDEKMIIFVIEAGVRGQIYKR